MIFIYSLSVDIWLKLCFILIFRHTHGWKRLRPRLWTWPAGWAVSAASSPTSSACDPCFTVVPLYCTTSINLRIKPYTELNLVWRSDLRRSFKFYDGFYNLWLISCGKLLFLLTSWAKNYIVKWLLFANRPGHSYKITKQVNL